MKALNCYTLLTLLLLAAKGRAASLGNWTLRYQTSPTSFKLVSVSCGNGLFVAVRNAGTILTSPDGASWTQRQSGTTASLSPVVYGNGQFLVFGDDGVSLTSSDGINWVQNPGAGGRSASIAFGNGTCVGVGTTLLDPPTPRGAYLPLMAVTYGNGRFVAVGLPATNGLATIGTSINGADWVPCHSGTTNPLFQVAYGNGSFVAVGGTGPRIVGPGTNTAGAGVILTSADGVN